MAANDAGLAGLRAYAAEAYPMSENQWPQIDPERVIADLRELDRLTGGADGAQRVAWTDEWRAARQLLIDRLAELGLEVQRDEAETCGRGCRATASLRWRSARMSTRFRPAVGLTVPWACSLRSG